MKLFLYCHIIGFGLVRCDLRLLGAAFVAEHGVVVHQRLTADGTDRVTTFSYLHQDSPVDFLQIYTLTDSDREIRATRGGRFVLKRQSGNVVYAAAFTEAAEWRHSIDEEELRSRFRIIPAEWSAGNQ